MVPPVQLASRTSAKTTCEWAPSVLLNLAGFAWRIHAADLGLARDLHATHQLPDENVPVPIQALRITHRTVPPTSPSAKNRSLEGILFKSFLNG